MRSFPRLNVAPTAEHVRQAMAIVRHGPEFDYFFERLSTPVWIDPLVEVGIFNNPPGPRRSGDGVMFPRWAPLKYLERMVPVVPTKVMDVLLLVPETDNPVVRGQMIDVALGASPEIASRLVDRARKWVVGPYHWLVPDKLADLSLYLAQGNQRAGAVAILRALLATTPSEEGERVRPSARFGDDDYHRIVTDTGPQVVAAAGLDGLLAATDALNAAAQIWFKAPKEEWSSFVRPSVGPHTQNSDRGVFDALVDLVRDGSVALVRAGHPVEEVLPILEARRFPIFERIALHVLADVAPTSIDLVEPRLVDPEQFFDSQLVHEYSGLLRAAYASLSPEARDSVLGMIRSGPRDESDLTDEQRDYWRLRRYSVLSEHLDGEDRTTYESLRAKFGEPEEPTILSLSRSWIGPTSPADPSAIERLGIEELVHFLNEWEPPSGPFADSTEGLGRALGAAVQSDPLRFSSEARRFVEVPAAYARGVISGLRDSLKAGKPVVWPPVLELAAYLITATEEPSELRGVRRDVGHLLEQGMSSGETQIPRGSWPEVWKLIEVLGADLEPDAEHESRFGGENMDPYTLAINTVRGQAMLAAIAFVLAAYRAAEADGTTWSLPSEIRNFIERHVDVTFDPSAAIHAVFGAYLPQIQILDSEAWFESICKKLLSGSGEAARAAWEAYLVFGRAYRNPFPHLEPLYRSEAAGDGKSLWRWPQSVSEALASHLLTYYLIGVISLDNSPLRILLDQGTERVRAELIEDAGRVVQDNENPLKPNQIVLLQSLWSDRISAANDDRNRLRPELAQFGWWMATVQLPNVWVLENALAVLEMGINLEPPHTVLPRLAELAEDGPNEAIRAVLDVIDLEERPWNIQHHRQEILSVVEVARTSGDDRAVRTAGDVVNRLAARGIQVAD